MFAETYLPVALSGFPLLGLGSIYLGELGIPITIFMVVGVTNAFNMLDGMDGLVSLVALVCFGGLSVITYFSGIASPEFALISSVLFIFLLFNLLITLYIVNIKN